MSKQHDASDDGGIPAAEAPAKRPPLNKYALACAVLASMNSILLGYDVSVMSGAQLFMKQDLKISDTKIEILAGIINIFSLVGSLAAGRTSDWIGRRYTMVLAAAIFFAGSWASPRATGSSCWAASWRASASGNALMIAPVYTAEVAPTSARGLLTSFPEVFINTGLLLGSLLLPRIPKSATMVNKEDGDGGGDRQLFADLSYRLLGFDDCPDLERQYKEAIEKRGGKYALRLNKESWTHLIIYSERIDYNDKFCMMARKLDITVVNEIWVDDSLSLGGLANPKRVLYWPVKELAGISGCLQLRISVYGYPLARSIEIQRMIHLMGATFCEEWTEKGTHLICYEFEGPVYNLAKKCKANVVNDKWLEDCLKEWKIVPIANYNTTSGSELELMETQSKGVNKQLVFKAKTPGRQYHTPESKLSSTDMTRYMTKHMVSKTNCFS